MHRNGRGFHNRRQFPVQDLREKLNKKRQDQQNTNFVHNERIPPPDPSYNFLRDPLRGDEVQDQQKDQPKRVSFAKNVDNRRPFQKGACPWKTTKKQPQYEQNSFSNPYLRKTDKDDILSDKNEEQIQDSECNCKTSDRKFPNIKVAIRKNDRKRSCYVDGSKTLEIPKEHKNGRYQLRDRSKFDKETKENSLLESCCRHLENLTI